MDSLYAFICIMAIVVCCLLLLFHVHFLEHGIKKQLNENHEDLIEELRHLGKLVLFASENDEEEIKVPKVKKTKK